MVTSTRSDVPASSQGLDSIRQANEYTDTNSTRSDETYGIDREYEDMVLPSASNRNSATLSTNPRRLLALLPILAIAATLTMAPRIEIYTDLACQAHRPELFHLQGRIKGNSIFGRPKAGGRSTQVELSGVAGNGVADFPTLSGLKSGSHLNLRHSAEGFSPFETETIPPSRQSLCASDPAVQAAVAKLTTVISACSGALVCATTGWWGSYSDRHGRRPVMVMSTLSLLITNMNFFLAVWFSKHIPGGYWFLVVGPVVEGLFGGLTVGVLVIQSYIADITDDVSRSGTFALVLGLLYSGLALGPFAGSLLVHFTGRIMSVFYASAFLDVIYAALVWTLIPETLLHKQMEDAKARLAADLDTTNKAEETLAAGILAKARRWLSFLRPLAVFLPVKVHPNGNLSKRSGRDWNLTLISVGYAITTCIGGSYSYKFLYATSTFHWTSETLGYWLSTIGATRALYLGLILPVIIKLLKPWMAPKLPVIDLDNEIAHLIDIEEEIELPSNAPVSDKEVHSSAFDINLARVSIIIDMTAFVCMGLSTASLPFAFFGIMGSFGTGFNPAADSVALALYRRRGETENGKLFGALSVLQTVCSQVIGPSLFGAVYINTVATFPSAIFFTSAFILGIAFLLVSLIRLPKGPNPPLSAATDAEEASSSLGEL